MSESEKFHDMAKPPEAVNIPAFLSKLWLLVEDKGTDPFIKWSDAGNSFIVFDPTQFAKEVLPKHFKHNNMTSFVRQLNMYGFRKKFHPEQGGLILNADSNQIEFEHPKFLRGNHKLLATIKRKMTTKEDLRLKAGGVNQILTDVKQMKTKQEGITGKLDNIQRENDALWREVQYLRKRHEQQQKIVSRLIQFLMTLVQNKNPLKRQQLPMIEDGVGSSSAKYSKQTDDIIENLQMGMHSSGEPSFPTQGATLLEVDDIATPAVAESDRGFLEPVTSNFPDAEEEPALDMVLRDENDFPIVTSPEGTELVSGSSGNYDTGQQILPDSSSTVNNSRDILPVYPSGQPSVSYRPVLGRPLSIEEQRNHIGDEVTGIQGNLDTIQSLLENSPKLNIENIWEVFRPDYGPSNQIIRPDNPMIQDFLSSLVSSNAPPPSSTINPKGMELVQYQHTNTDNALPSTIFSEEDENSLLTSLDEDARNLIPSDSTNKNNDSSLT